MNASRTDLDTVKDKGLTLIQSLRKKDAERPDFPGEHLIVLAVGTLFLLGAQRSRSMLGRSLMAGIGAALVGRAASGRGGIARIGTALRHRSGR
ncbi:MAG TPA: hypothetical protein VNQ97_11050 [Burkholderiaceae bacterium]|nr:hypothetical protein [Burkholderiaceae bacterium]